MPTRNVPRWTISSSREGCWACAGTASRKSIAAKPARTRFIELLRILHPASDQSPDLHAPATYRGDVRYQQLTAKGKVQTLRIGLAIEIRFWNESAAGRLTGLHFAAVFANHARYRGASGHFAFQLFEPPPRLDFAVVHEADRRIPGHRPADNGRGILADGLVDIIFAAVGAAGRPFEANRRHRTRTGLRIAVGLDQPRIRRPFLKERLFRLAMGFRLIQNAGDGRERIVGRVALTQ